MYKIMRQPFTVLRSLVLIHILSWQYVGATNISLTLDTPSISASNRQPLLATIVIDLNIVEKTQSISVSRHNSLESTNTRSTSSVVDQTGILIDTSFEPWVTPFGSLLPAGGSHHIPSTATPYRTNLSSPSNSSSGSTLGARPTTSLSIFQGHGASLVAMSRYYTTSLMVLFVLIQYAEHI